LKGLQSIILTCIRWYLSYKLSIRDLEEMMAERGVEVDHGFSAIALNLKLKCEKESARWQKAGAGTRCLSRSKGKRISLFLVGLGPAAALLSRLSKKLRKRSQAVLDNSSDLVEWLQRRLSGAETIKQYRTEQLEIERLNRSSGG
jgi:ABC-type multidrug transport system fused ATPase/permease subunit